MVDTAVRIALEELRDRRILPERLEQLDLGVRQRDEHGGDAVLGLRHRRRHLRAQRLAVDPRGRRDVAHRDGDVIEPSDHRSLQWPGSSPCCVTAWAVAQSRATSQCAWMAHGWAGDFGWATSLPTPHGSALEQIPFLRNRDLLSIHALAHVHSRSRNGVASLAYAGEPEATSPGHALTFALRFCDARGPHGERTRSRRGEPAALPHRFIRVRHRGRPWAASGLCTD